MRVLIHALGAAMGGAVRHLSSFTPALGEVGRHEYHILTRDGITLEDNSRVKVIKNLSCGSTLPSRLISDLFRIPMFAKTNGYDCIVSLTNFGPIWSTVPHILYQRNPTYYCEGYLRSITPQKRAEALARRRLTYSAMRRARVVVTPSHSMREMIRSVYPELSEQRFRVIYHGFSKEGYAEPLNPRIRALFRPGRHYLLYPTHASGHKAMDVLVNIAEALTRKREDTVIICTASDSDWPEGMPLLKTAIEARKLTERLVFIGNVPQCQMGELYSLSSLVLYPSTCESFGFSMTEAMAFGKPIVAAGTPVNIEMCGTAAAYYPPFDSAAGAVAADWALGSGPTAWLREQAKMRMASFDRGWHRYVREFDSLLDEACGS